MTNCSECANELSPFDTEGLCHDCRWKLEKTVVCNCDGSLCPVHYVAKPVEKKQYNADKSALYSPLIFAIDFAAKKHRDQRRKNCIGAPYINHPIDVMNILANEASVTDQTILIAAVLHDTIEDTDTTESELVRVFGQPIASLVMELTDDKNLPAVERKRLQITNAAHKSSSASMIKMADKLSNCRDLCDCPPESWSLKRVQGYFVWSYSVINNLRCKEWNTKLYGIVDTFFKGTFHFDGKEYPILPKGDLSVELENYLELIAKS